MFAIWTSTTCKLDYYSIPLICSSPACRSCPSPPPNVISSKQQRDKYRQRLLAAFESHYHPDYSVPRFAIPKLVVFLFFKPPPVNSRRHSLRVVSDLCARFKQNEEHHHPLLLTRSNLPSGGILRVLFKRLIVFLQTRYPTNRTILIGRSNHLTIYQFKKPSLFKRISSFGVPKRPPQLSVAEQLIQHSIRKRATAFVDARDDLETKIGRLSRRLNFLMTESDLWRDKFVTFEQYAEKLSAEAQQLRTKINKEQREAKRLSGLVTLTAVEKTKLQTRKSPYFLVSSKLLMLISELRDTESAHKEATLELERMRETMEKMEQERAEMVAEVEAQIERALASMAVGMDDSDYSSSRPQSRLSDVSGTHSRSQSRRPSDASKSRHLRSFGTESTLAESYGEDSEAAEDETIAPQKIARENGTIAEDDEEDQTITKKKRFSASDMEVPQDGMNAVDEGISQKSDKIAQKVLEIQQKVRSIFFLSLQYLMPIHTA